MGQGLTAEKMTECIWLKPETVAQVEFLQWTGADYLRHTKFIGMRDEKDPRKIVRGGKCLRVSYCLICGTAGEVSHGCRQRSACIPGIE